MAKVNGEYPEIIVKEMEEALTSIGFKSLKTASEVEDVLDSKKNPEDFVFVVNSVCKCAAGAARPGVKKALELATEFKGKRYCVFAGVDKESTEKAREFFDFPPSSPNIIIFREGKPVFVMQRKDIVHKSADEIADELKEWMW